MGQPALSIVMKAMDIGAGDEVLMPGYFWISCPTAVVLAGAIPRLVDIDDTWSIDLVTSREKSAREPGV